MSNFPYEKYDGIGLGELVHRKEVSAKELADEAIKRIEAHNPKLNAVIHKMYDQAYESAEMLKSNAGLFAGVPMLLKDITQEIAGERITSGSKLFKEYKAKRDCEYVSRLRQEGVVFLGQTNVPELALMGITEPEYYGATRNPWNLDYTPGGSSGGSAAAVASGMVPIAGANDGGGSIRIPAAFCGLFGLKPSRGRTPVGPGAGRHWQGASSEHVLTRSVRDSAAMLDILKKPEKAAAFSVPAEHDYMNILKKPLDKKLKVAYSFKSPLGGEVHTECKNAVDLAVKLLDEMGHIVEEREAPVDGMKIAKSYLTMYFGEVAAAVASAETLVGKKAKFDDVEPTTWLLSLLGKATSAEEFVLSLREWDQAAFMMAIFHESYDLYLTPTTAFPPSRIGELEPKKFEKLAISLAGRLNLGKPIKKMGIVDQIAENSLGRTPFTQLANLTGQPAMTLPLYQTAEGLPCGVQFLAARGREDLLLQTAAKFENSPNWINIYNNPFMKRE